MQRYVLSKCVARFIDVGLRHSHSRPLRVRNMTCLVAVAIAAAATATNSFNLLRRLEGIVHSTGVYP